MIIFVLAIVVVILFVVGVAFIYKGYTSTPDPEQVVPKKEFQNAQNDLEQAKEQEDQLRLQLDSLAIKMEETKGQLQETDRIKESVELMRDQTQQQKGLIQNLKTDVKFIASKADAQAQEAIEVINKLTDENEDLAKRLQETADKVDSQDVAKLNSENVLLQDQLEQNLEKIKELEDFLIQTKKESSGKRTKAESFIEELSKENQKMKDGLHEITSRMEEVAAEVTHAQGEDSELSRRSAELSRQLQQAQERIARMEKEIQVLGQEKLNNDGQIKELKDSLVHQKKVSNEEDSGSEKKDGSEKLKEYQDLNRFLAEKEKVLQFELNKSRARAIGLEKLCEGLKAQLERSH